MGCFPAYFISKRRKRHNSTPSKDQGLETIEALYPIELAKRENVGELIKLVRESNKLFKFEFFLFDLVILGRRLRSKLIASAKKWVTFFLNVKSYEESSVKEVACDLAESGEEKRSGIAEEALKENEPLFDNIALTKVASFTPNNRYQDCRKSTDECEDLGLEDIDLEEEEDDDNEKDKRVVVQEESSESLFSLSIDSRKHACDAEKGKKEVSSPMPTCSFSKEEFTLKTTGSCRNAKKWCHFGESVLNSIENFTQWKDVKERPVSTSVQHQEKKNASLEQDVSILISPEPSLKLANRSSKPDSSEMKHAAGEEIGVDTSLSSWLVGSEVRVKSKASDDYSVGNSETGEERELKRVSAPLSPTRSRSRNPCATPLIGTVGSYWVHTGQNMDSDSSSSESNSELQFYTI